MKRFSRYLALNSFGGTAIFQTIIMAAGAVSGITLARSLGPGGRGDLAIAMLWPGILVLLTDLGLGFAFSYHVGKDKECLSALWTFALIVGLAGGIGMAALGWFVLPDFVPALRGAARLGFAAALFSVPMVLTGGYQAYLLLGSGMIADYNAIRTAVGLSYLVFVFAFASLGWNSVHDFAVTYVLAQACGLILATALTLKRLRPRIQFRSDLIVPVFSYGLKTQMSNMASQVNLRADQTVMSLMLPAAQLGQYVVAVAVSGALSPLLSALAVVILPRTAQAANDRGAALLVTRHIRIAFLFLLPVVALSIAMLPWALPAFFGKDYAQAVLCAQILMVAELFAGINMVLNNSLRGIGRAGLPAIAETAGMAATIVLLYLLLPRFGIAGAAVASLGVYAAVAVLQFSFIAKAADLTMAELVSVPLGGALRKKPGLHAA